MAQMPYFAPRHYRLLAAALAESKPVTETWVNAQMQWHADVAAIAAAFLTDNPKFDNVRFLNDCMTEGKQP